MVLTSSLCTLHTKLTAIAEVLSDVFFQGYSSFSKVIGCPRTFQWTLCRAGVSFQYSSWPGKISKIYRSLSPSLTIFAITVPGRRSCLRVKALPTYFIASRVLSDLETALAFFGSFVTSHWKVWQLTFSREVLSGSNIETCDVEERSNGKLPWAVGNSSRFVPEEAFGFVQLNLYASLMALLLGCHT